VDLADRRTETGCSDEFKFASHERLRVNCCCRDFGGVDETEVPGDDGGVLSGLCLAEMVRVSTSASPRPSANDTLFLILAFSRILGRSPLFDDCVEPSFCWLLGKRGDSGCCGRGDIADRGTKRPSSESLEDRCVDASSAESAGATCADDPQPILILNEPPTPLLASPTTARFLCREACCCSRKRGKEKAPAFRKSTRRLVAGFESPCVGMAVSAKAAADARLQEERQKDERKKSAIVLMLHHLIDSGYVSAAEALRKESGISPDQWTPADNMDLLTVIQEFEAFFHMKFSRRPKLCRRTVGAPSSAPSRIRPANARAAEAVRKAGQSPSQSQPQLGVPTTADGKPPRSRQRRNSVTTDSRPTLPKIGGQPASVAGSAASHMVPNINSISKHLGGDGARPERSEDSPSLMSISGITNSRDPSPQQPRRRRIPEAEGESGTPEERPATPPAHFESQLLKPLPQEYRDNAELAELATLIQRDIFTANPNVRWSDIVGLDTAKRLLQEAIVLPVRYPELFTGILQPWKGSLLFGSPGTGKTMLAKAVATECDTTFFNISASTIVSKWRGDSEKLVRVLFDLARHHAPSTIFLDEIDAIMSQRGEGGSGEHEASRRLKTELLIQMDGLAKTADQVFLLCVSNLPWELDTAMLRRLEKRIFVPLPDVPARVQMLKDLLPPGERSEPNIDFGAIAKKLDGYSGSDIRLVCKEAAMAPARRLVSRMEAEEPGVTIDDIEKVTAAEIEEALGRSKPAQATKANMQKYAEWQAEYGAN
jgi:katanin p60 ATPase-containing subunit A1